MIYRIPNHRNPNHPYEKGITVSEFEAAARQLDGTGELNQSWFQKSLPGCAREGSCNFTTLGGIFELLGRAEYAGPGVYRRRG
ncbi:MAG: hypothetical protein RQ826_16385 [Xanthomonadales bacterium]|nr:hypothetical protein [Xanthomonadales bacterium]